MEEGDREHLREESQQIIQEHEGRRLLGGGYVVHLTRK